MGNFTLGGIGGGPTNSNIHEAQHQFFMQNIMTAEDQRTQVMNSSALRFNMTSDQTPDGQQETQVMYHHIPPYVNEIETGIDNNQRISEEDGDVY